MNAVQLYAFGNLRERIVKIGYSRSKTFQRKKAHENRGHEDVKMVTFGAWWGMQADESYYSPEAFVEPARITFGGTIDCDPASCKEADRIIKAIRYYSWREDGLSQQWFGCVWLNPPYSQWDLWGDKLIEEMGSGRVKEAIVLAETRVTTAKYFFKTAKHASAYLMVNGRRQFWGPKAGSCDEGHALLYFGPNPGKFAVAYSLIGKTFFSAPPNPGS